MMPLVDMFAGFNKAAAERGVVGEYCVAAIIEGARAKGEATGVATVSSA